MTRSDARPEAGEIPGAAPARSPGRAGPRAMTAVLLLGIPLSFSIPGATAVLLILGIYGLVCQVRLQALPADLRGISRALAALYALVVAVDVLNGGGAENLYVTGGQYLPLLLVAPFALTLRRLRPRISRLELAMGGSLMLAVVYNAWQVQTHAHGGPMAYGLDLFPGTPLWPGPYGMALLTWTVFLALRGLERPVRDGGWPRLVFAGVGALAVLLTNSRTAVLAFGAAAVMLMFYWALRRGNRAVALLLSAGTVAALGALAYALPVTERVGPAVAQALRFFEEGAIENTSLGTRFALWEGAWWAFLEKPVLGHGLANTVAAATEGQRLSSLYIADQPHLHNDYLQQMVAFGVFGLVFFLGFFGVVAWGAGRQTDPALRAFGRMLVLILMLYACAEIVFNILPVTSLACLGLGLVLGLKPESLRGPH